MFAKFSVKKPLTVFVAVMMVIILGIVSFTKMTPDLLPSINLPYAIVVTSYPGATPEEVETQVSKPMEQSMASLENIKDISSVSRENMSQLMLQFNDSVNMDSVVSDIREKINAVSGAWDDKVGTPFIMKLNPDLLPVVVSAVGYGDKNNIELTEFLNQDLMSKLEGITGVASVNVNGNVTEKIDVTLSEEKLKAINDKIKKSLDGKFENAEEELNEKRTDLQEGKNELENKTGDLESAKSELESGKAALLDQSAQAQGQLLNKKTELENTKMEIKQQMEQAKSNLTLLKESEKAISQLNTSLQEVNSQIAVLDETIASLQQIQTTYDGLQQQKTALEQEIAGIEAGTIIPEGDPAEALAALRAELGGVTAQIAALEATLAEMGTTPAELSGKIVELQGKKTALSTALSEINSAMAMLGVTPETIETTLGEIQTNIGAIESGLAQMEGALVELDSGAVSMNDALAELNRQQLQGSMEISGGLSQIMAGQSSLSAAKSQMSAAEKQLDGAQGDFEQKKDSAYKSANVEITMDMVNQILMAQNFSMPVGYITGGEVDYLVRVGDKIQDVEALQNLLLFDTGVEGVEKIYLKDVATVALTDNAAELYAKINGSDGVILSFSKQSTYATATVSENINKKFSELSKEYEGLTFSNLSDQGDYINIVVKTVLDNLVLGAILAVLILLIFLKDIKPTVVIACSIPISVLFAVVLMYFSGITLNVISLSGLAIGVGMLVDNSVVVIENIYRMRKEGQSVLQAAVTGATQVTGAIVASTLTTICVFLPIAFVEGITRQLFVDMALTIAYSLLASLIVALTLVPAMASGMLKKDNEKSHKIFDRFLQGYDKLARVSLKHKWVVIAFSVILLVGSTFLVLQKGFIF
ncbi:MAG: efflux RND transporter permease subunit, partial [Oscillospiraceae bacterium]